MLLAAKPDDDDELPAARGHGPLGFNYMLGGARRLAFISYRRADSAGQTGRIHDHLKSRFGPGRVFRDITIPPGLDWRQRIETSLIDCVVVIAVIGNGWVCKRLSHPDDLLRHELEVALQRNIGVIPVLVDGATLPRPRDLPTSLRGLLDAQALEIHEEDFDHDIRKLIDRVRAGERIVVTRHGKPAVAIVPPDAVDARLPSGRPSGFAALAGRIRECTNRAAPHRGWTGERPAGGGLVDSAWCGDTRPRDLGGR